MLKSDIKILQIQENKIELHIINIRELTDEIKNIFDNFLVKICHGNSDSTINDVKKELKNFFEGKSDKIIRGALAELLVHIYLNSNEFKQEFLFFNLEENSIKKGFDGYFSKGGEEFIVESKAGTSSSQGSTHKNKLQTAYSNLKDYVEGTSKKGKNNPWHNAYSHASHIDVGTDKEIRKKIQLLSSDYSKNIYRDINEFNVIPCSTMFLEEKWNDEVTSQVSDSTKNSFLSEFNGKSVKAICITKISEKQFFDYITQ